MRLTVLCFLLFLKGYLQAQSWKTYADTANIFQSQRNNVKATEYYTKAIAILPADSFFTTTQITLHDSLGKISIDLQQYKLADSCYSKSLQIRQRLFGENSKEYAAGCFNLGYLYTTFLSRNKEAEPLLVTSKKLTETTIGKQTAEYAQSCHYLANVYTNTGKLDQGLQLHNEAKQIRDQIWGAGNIESAKTVMNIGNIYFRKTDYPNAIKYYRQAKDDFQKVLSPTHPFIIGANQNIALSLNYMSQYFKSLPILLEMDSLIIATLGKDNLQYLSNGGYLGALYRDIGEYKKAEEIFLNVKSAMHKILGVKSQRYAAVCWNLGTLYHKMGQYKKSEAYLLECKSLREQLGEQNSMAYAATCESLAETYLAKREYDKVEGLLLESKKIRENIAGDLFSNSLLGSFYLLTSQFDKAIAILTAGEKVLQKTKETETEYYLHTISQLGYAYLNMNDLQQAKDLFLKSRRLVEDIYGKQHKEYARLSKSLAETNWMLNNKVDAYNEYMNALSTQKVEIQKIFGFTSEEEKQLYLNSVADFRNSFLSFCLNGLPADRQGDAYNFVISNRNLTLSSTQRLIQEVHAVADPAIKNKFNEWVNAKKQLALWYTKPKNQRPDDLRSFEAQAETLEKAITAKLSSTLLPDVDISWESISDKLKDEEAALEFVEFPYYDAYRLTDSIYYAAFLLRKAKAEPLLIPLFEKGQLDSIIDKKHSNQIRTQINQVYSISKETSKNDLFETIWKPLEEHLNGVKKIYFAPAGSLFKISFAALPINAQQVLNDKYALVQLNTTSSVLDFDAARISNKDQIKLYGGIKYDVDSMSIRQIVSKYADNDIASRSLPDNIDRNNIGFFNYLEGSEDEIKGIQLLAQQKNFPAISIDVGLDASEESFKSLSGNRSPGVLHLATHGFFFPDPALSKIESNTGGSSVFQESDIALIRSGLALAGANNAWRNKPVSGVEDGILTAYEISNMYLPNTRLAVLSACETGLGDIKGSEGVFGLQRAFKIAGAKNLVMSLWEADDVAATEFMQEFYKRLFEKTPIHEAFLQAQKMLKAKYLNDPYKWATWILIR